MKAWIRELSVILTSRKLKKSITFGDNWKSDKDDLDIKVAGTKYMSTMKDSFTVEISNLTYNELVYIIDGEFYDIEIKCGYRDIGSHTIFDGGIAYISNQLTDNKTHTAILLCTSKLVARYSQTRLNLTFNSGINLYSAVTFAAKRSGIKDASVSTQLKKIMIETPETLNQNAGAWIDELTKQRNMLCVNTDGSDGATFSIFDASKSNSRVIKLTSNSIIAQSFPQLTSEGLTLSLLPTFNFICGDTIEIDNSIIDISSTSINDAYKGYYLDKEGHYMVFEQRYSLQNRGSQFTLKLNCKSRAIVSNYLGVK